MKALSHPVAALSIGLAAMAGIFASVAVEARMARPSPYFGRWTINEPNPTLTARGKLYKTIDIAPCGKDFCGVSVGDKGQCGAVLFRFLTKNAYAPFLHGKGKWGSGKKNVQLEAWDNPENPQARQLEVFVGDGYSFGGRSESMPKFNAVYDRKGEARCKAR